MSGTTGETTWSSKGREAAKRPEFLPVPQKDWEAVIRGDGFEVKAGKQPGDLSYVTGKLEILDSAMTPGGKNRYIFPMFWLSLKPGKDQKTAPERENNVIGVARALGEETPDFTVLNVTANIKDSNDNVTGTEEVQMLDPRAVVQWFKDHDGQTLRLHSKIDTYLGKQKAVVDYFIESTSKAAF